MSNDSLTAKQPFPDAEQETTLGYRLSEETDCAISGLTKAKNIILLTDFHCPNDIESQYFCTFFSRILKETTDSIFLITGAAKLDFLGKLRAQFQNQVVIYSLKGLDEKSSARILEDEGIQQEPGFKTLVNIYKENPAMLKVVAREIKSKFHGSAAAFCELIIHKNSILTGKFPPYYSFTLQRCPLSARELIKAIPAAKQEGFTLLDLLPKHGPSIVEDLQVLVDYSLIEKVSSDEHCTYRISRIVRHLAHRF